MRINIYTCGIQLVLSYPTLTMHGHMNLKINIQSTLRTALICVKMFHLQCYLVTTVIHIQSVRCQIRVYILMSFTIQRRWSGKINKLRLTNFGHYRHAVKSDPKRLSIIPVLSCWRSVNQTRSLIGCRLTLNTWLITKYHTANKCTNCMSLILNHFFKTLFTAPTCSDSISLIIIREHIQFLAKITC